MTSAAANCELDRLADADDGASSGWRDAWPRARRGAELRGRARHPRRAPRCEADEVAPRASRISRHEGCARPHAEREESACFASFRPLSVPLSWQLGLAVIASP